MENIMKQIIAGIFLFLSVPFVLAGHHEGESKPVYQFFHFSTLDEAAVVKAFDDFFVSDCGKEFPGNIAIAREFYNGSDTSTHFMIAGFKSHKDRVAGEMTSCPPFGKWVADMNAAGALPWKSERLVQAVKEVKDWSQDTAFLKYDFNVAPQDVEQFVGIWDELMASLTEEGLVTNSYGLEEVLAGTKDFTHFAYVGHTDRALLAEQSAKVTSSEAYKEYLAKAADLRTSTNTTMVYIVKSWAGKN
tara:strand:+ start:508 stop:1245 length:738 start_codon:yes stop_codon:yes gene_type:complete